MSVDSYLERREEIGALFKREGNSLPLGRILDAAGLRDAMTLLECDLGRKEELHSFACDCVARALPIWERIPGRSGAPREAYEAACSGERVPTRLYCEVRRAAEACLMPADRAAANACAYLALGEHWMAVEAAAAARPGHSEGIYQIARFRQYLDRGGAAADLPWPDRLSQQSMCA